MYLSFYLSIYQYLSRCPTESSTSITTTCSAGCPVDVSIIEQHEGIEAIGYENRLKRVSLFKKINIYRHKCQHDQVIISLGKIFLKHQGLITNIKLFYEHPSEK